MDYRFAVIETASGPKICKVPVRQSARFVNEYPDVNPQIFESLEAAKNAALAIVERGEANTKPDLSAFAARTPSPSEQMRQMFSTMTEDQVERFFL